MAKVKQSPKVTHKPVKMWALVWRKTGKVIGVVRFLRRDVINEVRNPNYPLRWKRLWEVAPVLVQRVK